MIKLHGTQQFRQQLRQLMPNVEKADDRLARLRHYLAAGMTPYREDNEAERMAKAAELIAKWKSAGIDQDHFNFGLAPDFRQWWATQVSTARSMAAKSRKPKSQQRKNAIDRPR
ncbi:MAG TPA: hypothetical protein VG167_19305 [Verrucomicrobiae bacterium]|nr:hypothetical protein [Verrucomicrobiae bacterium]